MQMLRTYSNRWMILLLSLFVMNSARAGDGGGVVKAMAVLDGSLHQITVDSSRTVEDSAFFNPAYVSNLDTAYSVQNIVTLKINEASTVYLHDTFTCNVQLRIYYTVGTSTLDSIDRSFTVRYDSASTYNARNSFVFYGARKVTVKVLSVNSSVSTWDPIKALMVENLIVTRPKFIFSCTNTVSSITVTPVPDTADELPVSWTAVLGADQYDLEWTYIDSSALRNNRYPDLSKVFLNNASRASVSGTSYRIPLMYDDTGVVFIRVRPVQLGAANSVTAAEWSSEASTPVIGSYTFQGHQPSMNWQSNISYAEEGKRKVVVQYFDGSLRSRQTVTKDNTTNTTIVAETYYDYQGRPAIQVMPSPTLNTVIQYTAGFNVSVNGAEYSQSNYDSLPGMGAICDIHADPMDTTTGASQYYSTNNPTKTLGMNQFIPDAKKYPFTETEYTPDNTGRISRQGGVGPDHQLGSGHETKYFYGTPDQDELDGLFGTEVGEHTHYFKNMVRDANGQYSVSYVDMHGRTIATALAGNTPEHLSALPSNTSRKVTENMLDSNAVATIQDLSMISQKSLLVPMADTFNFHYSLTPDVFSEMNCANHTVCYTCLYDLEITITDNCNNQLLGGKAFDTVVNNLTISDSCSPSTLSVDFSKVLPEGAYLITKKLTVDRDSYINYLNNFYLPGNTCSNLTQYISGQDSIIAATTGQCAPDCASCRAAVGDWPAFWTNFRTQAGIADADTAAYKTEAMTAYQNALSACDDLCRSNESDANDLRKAMLQDLTPPFGQYADTTKRPTDDIYSIFYQRANDISFVPVYKLPAIVYKDDNGNPDKAYNAQSDLMVDPNTLTVSQFVQAFRPSWAEALLPYHPEYCKLVVLEGQDSSNKWDRHMESIEDYQTAYDQGFLNPTGRGYDTRSPWGYFNFIVPTGEDPLLTSPFHKDMQNAMWEKIMHFQPAQGGIPELSMWNLAVVMAKCPTNDNACILKYSDAGHIAHQNLLDEMCTADKDQAWRNFRQMYLDYKHFLNFHNQIDPSLGCTPTDTRVYGKAPVVGAIYAANHQPRFIDSYTGLSNNGLGSKTSIGGPTAAGDDTVAAKDSLQQAYAQNVQALQQQWRALLSTCKLYSSVDLDTLTARLYRFASAGCDGDHPFGASTLPPGVSSPLGGNEKSFQDIIKEFNVSKGYNDDLHCNAEQITMPGPYDKQPAYALKPVYSRPSDCECKLITDLYNTYVAAGSPLTFSGYLQKTQQITMSDADLSSLRALCANTTNSASCISITHPILLPPAMQCYVGPTCASCDTVRSVYRSYLRDYPADTPRYNVDVDTTQAQKNLLFQNYMNSRLGFTKQAWEYLQFLDTCAAHSDTTSTNQCVPRTIADLFKTGGTDVMLDMKRTTDGGYILVGSTTRTGAGTDAYIIRYDSSNNIQWAKSYRGAGNENFNKVRVTLDGGYIAVGTTYSPSISRILVVKLSSDGTTQWQKTYGYSGVGERGFDVIQTTDGGYAVTGDDNIGNGGSPGSGGSAIFVIRMDSAGTLVWSRRLKQGNTGNDGYGIHQIGSTLWVTGRNFDGSDRFYGGLYSLNSSTGNLINEYHYADPNGDISMSFLDIYPRGTGYRVFLFKAYETGSDSSHMAIADMTGAGIVTRYKVVNVPPGTAASGGLNAAAYLATSDGGFLVGQSPMGQTNIYWTKADSAGSAIWSRQTVLPNTQLVGAIAQNTDSSYSALGSDSGTAMLLKLSSTGTTGCYDSTVNITIATLGMDTVAITSTVDSLLPNQQDSTLSEGLVGPTDSPITCSTGGSCYIINNGPTLCGKAAPVFPPMAEPPITACTDSTFFAVSKGTVLYNYYTDSLTGDFEHQYLAKCLQAYKHEVFTVTHSQREYHYTLYYYDQAGNLLKTIPPAGVDQHMDGVWLSDVRAARAAGGKKVPSHTLVTNYRYNTLNQVVTQRTPDGGTSFFWYDRLGRLCLSQNARQVPNNQYSYTLYDSIGRITQVGQLVSSTPPTDVITRSESSLSSWITAVASSEEQITATTYDSANYYAIPALAAHNLRNRVAWTALYNTHADLVAVPGNHAAATYYSYDILGNVDTLVQDYKQGSMANQLNRLKKIVYNYDLVSGKVNKVSYQHGQVDAFYHTYFYDAENRITNVQSSMDSINWDNDAFYSYYAHGPLARTILGEQQVQGINYAYTLQGWLKAINPDINTSGAYTLRPDSASNVVAASAYNLLLNYYNGDYRPISGAGALDNGVYSTLGADSMPLFNGNISSMALSVRKLDNPLLYNYRYDQLNRLIHMDAWKRTGSDWSAITKMSDYQEDIGYDPNGNILRYKRNGTTAGGLDMDKLQYNYTAGTNQLDHIYDTVGTPSSYDDIKTQAAGNYKYDSIGQLVSDDASHISNITWTVYGKIASITKGGDTTVLYTYDPGGNRISKSVVHSGDTLTTWYVRDGQGNVMSVYTYGDPAVHGKDLTQTELHIYGSSRLGIWRPNKDVYTVASGSAISVPLLGTGDSVTFTRGNKFFELTNHLGNVLATISDKRFGVTSDSVVQYYLPDVVSANDYYPFGMLQPGRTYAQSGTGYRYGFNGQEKSDEIKGSGNSYTAEYWEYDPRIGRRWNVEPKIKNYPWNSPYNSFHNNPIQNKDPDGGDPITAIFEGLTAFGIEAGLDFLTSILVENKNAEEAFNSINWKGATWEGVKATAMSAFLPTGSQTAVRLAKIGKSKIGKLTISFVTNLTNEAFKNYLKGDYDEDGSFSFDKLRADFTNLVYTAGISTLLDAGLGNKAEELFKKLEKSNAKLAKEYEKLFKVLSKPEIKKEVIERRIKKLDEAAKKLGKDAAKATAAKAKDETIKKAADETQKKIRNEKKE